MWSRKKNIQKCYLTYLLSLVKLPYTVSVFVLEINYKTGSTKCDCKRDGLWIRFSLGEMKY